MRSSSGTIGACKSALVRGSSAETGREAAVGSDGARCLSRPGPAYRSDLLYASHTHRRVGRDTRQHTSARLSIGGERGGHARTPYPRVSTPRTASGGATTVTAIAERTLSTRRHTTHYLEAGPPDGAAASSHARQARAVDHVAPPARAFGRHAATAARAPDMRGYGGSSRRRATALRTRCEHIVHDMTDLLHALGAQRAVWIGHDWGRGGRVVRWRRIIPELCHAVVRPVRAVLLPTASRRPPSSRSSTAPCTRKRRSPAGQWDYQLFYEQDLDGGAQGVRSGRVRATFKTLYRAGSAEGRRASRRRPRASTRDGGWVGGMGRAPDLPRDPAVMGRRRARNVRRGVRAHRLFRPQRLVRHDNDRNVEYAARVARRRRAAITGALRARNVRHGLRNRRLAAGPTDAPRLHGSHRARRRGRALAAAAKSRTR